MATHDLFTIGHSSRELGEFLSMLIAHDITAVADVRSHPRSQKHPQFNSDALKAVLRDCGMNYVFLGRELGARRTERECYWRGIAKYDLIAATDAFQRGLDRIRRGLKSHRIALMCAERDPIVCHRSILICRHLRHHARIQHIIGPEHLEGHLQLEARLRQTIGLPERSLFECADELLEDAYNVQGEAIAYRTVLRRRSSHG